MRPRRASERPESAMCRDLEPLPPDTPSSDGRVIELLFAENQVYREIGQVVLEKLADIEKRLKDCQRTLREYRIAREGAS